MLVLGRAFYIQRFQGSYWRSMSDSLHQRIEQLDAERGIITDVNSKSLTPFQLLANRTIGLSREHVVSNGKTKKQNVGLEKSYDSLLTGQKGERLVRFIAGGVAIPVEGYQVEPENGKDIVTTIDVNIQDIAETALMKMMLQRESQYGTAIVTETKT